MIKIANTISKGKIADAIHALDPQKPTVIWYGVSAGDIDEQRKFEQAFQKITEQIKALQSEKATLHSAKSTQENDKKTKDLQEELFKLIQNSEHKQRGAHFNSFIDSMVELSGEIRKANGKIEKMIVYDTSTLHRNNLYWFDALKPSEINIKKIQDKFRKTINKKTLEAFGITYQEAARLLYEDETIKKSKTLFLGDTWREAHQLLKTLIEKKNEMRLQVDENTSISNSLDKFWETDTTLSDLWTKVTKKREWFQKAAEFLGDHWIEAYYLLEAMSTTVFGKNKANQIPWENINDEVALSSIYIKYPYQSQRLTCKERFERWSDWYQKAFQLFGKTWEDADRALREIVQAAIKDIKSNPELSKALQESAQLAFNLFAVPWTKENKQQLSERTKPLQDEGVEVSHQYWQDWYQTDKAQEYNDKIQTHYYHKKNSFRNKVHEVALERIQQNTERLYQSTHKKRKEKIERIDFTDLAHVLVIEYILEETARIWFLAEEYQKYNIIFTYPSLQPQKAVEQLLSHKGLGLLNTQLAKTEPQKKPIIYFGFNYSKVGQSNKKEKKKILEASNIFEARNYLHQCFEALKTVQEKLKKASAQLALADAKYKASSDGVAEAMNRYTNAAIQYEQLTQEQEKSFTSKRTYSETDQSITNALALVDLVQQNNPGASPQDIQEITQNALLRMTQASNDYQTESENTSNKKPKLSPALQATLLPTPRSTPSVTPSPGNITLPLAVRSRSTTPAPPTVGVAIEQPAKPEFSQVRWRLPTVAEIIARGEAQNLTHGPNEPTSHSSDSLFAAAREESRAALKREPTSQPPSPSFRFFRKKLKGESSSVKPSSQEEHGEVFPMDLDSQPKQRFL